MTKTRSEKATQHLHAIAFTQSIMYVKYADRSVAKVTKPNLITYQNIERKYRVNPMNLDRNTIK